MQAALERAKAHTKGRKGLEAKYAQGRKVQSYYENGNLKEEVTYTSQNKMIGEHKLFYQNGEPKQVAYYNDLSRLEKEKITYDSTGYVIKEPFINGIKEGTARGYYPSGELFNESIYIRNRRQGEYKEYHKNGKIAVKGHYKHDNEHGDWIHYRKNGKPEKTVTYKYGKKVSEKKL